MDLSPERQPVRRPAVIPRKDQKWWRNFGKLEARWLAGADLNQPLPCRHEQIWRNKQRSRHQYKMLAPEKVLALQALGVCLEPNEERWEHNFEAIKAKFRPHWVPGYTPLTKEVVLTLLNKQELNWLRYQNSLRQARRLRCCRRQALEALGIRWKWFMTREAEAKLNQLNPEDFERKWQAIFAMMRRQYPRGDGHRSSP